MHSSSLEEAILFVFFGLTIGAICTYLLSRHLPNISHIYTVILFFIGVFIQFLIHVNPSEDINPLRKWNSIEGDAILYIFLPLLLFGEAMTLNWYYVKKVILPATLLAFPGAILGAFMIAVSCRLIVSSEWSWVLCWTVGAILSATDPVSVVALLKKLSLNTAPQMGLTYLIIGEALLNDGSGLVLFEALTEKTDIDPVIFFATKFARVIVISPIIGIIIGYITIILMRITNKRFSDEDATVQVALTIACAYGSFFSGQFFFEVSGVISCCAAGVILGWLSPPLILQKHNMHLIWSMFEWIGNSFIFILAGVVVGDKFWNYASMKEIGIIFIMYFICTLIRVTVLLICHFPVKYFLPEYTFREASFTSFAGVRGAVGLAMVLVLEEHVVSNASSEAMLDKIVFPDTDVESCVFIICGIITLTILINGTLAGEILLLLGVTTREIPYEEEIILHYVKKRLKRTTRVQFENLELALPVHDKELIGKICTRLKPFKKNSSSNSSTPFNSPPSSLKKDAFIKTADIELKLEGNNIQIPKIHTGFDSTPSKDNSFISPARSLSFNVLSPSNHRGRSPVTNVSNLNSHPRLSSFNIVNDSVNCNSLPNSLKLPKSNSFNLTDEQMAQIIYGSSSNEKLSSQISDNFLGIKRDVEDELISELITNFRHKFLDVVRKSYFNQMHSGVLPRESNGALILLESCDFGHETTNTPGLQDWGYIEKFVNTNSFFQRIESYTGINLDFLGPIKTWEIAKHDADRIYVITSFIEAHEYAQKNIAHYLGEEEYVDTPEEAIVVSESNTICNNARNLLETLDNTLLTLSLSKQICRVLLYSEEESINHYEEEGLLSSYGASTLYKNPHKDLHLLSKRSIIDAWVNSQHEKITSTSHDGNHYTGLKNHRSIKTLDLEEVDGYKEIEISISRNL